MNADLNPTQRSTTPTTRRTQNPPGPGSAPGAGALGGVDLFASLLQAAEAATAGDAALPQATRVADKNFEHHYASSLVFEPPWPTASPDSLSQALPSAGNPTEMLDLSTQALANQDAGTAPDLVPTFNTHADSAAASAKTSADHTQASFSSSPSLIGLGSESNRGDTGAATSAGTSSPGRTRAKNGSNAGTGLPVQGGRKGELPVQATAANPSSRAIEQAHSHAAFLRTQAIQAQAASALLPVLPGLPVNGWQGAPVASTAALNADPAMELSGHDSVATTETMGRAGSGGATGNGSNNGSHGGHHPGAAESGMPAGLDAGSASSASAETASLGSEFAQQLDAALNGEGWAGVFEPLGHQISLWAAGQTRKAQLLLHEGLRQSLQVELRLDDAQAHLDFYTDDAALREALLEQARAALSELLGRSGLELAGLSVGARTAGDTHAQSQNGRNPALQVRVNPSASSDAPAGGARDLAQQLRSGTGRAGLSVYV